MNIFATSDDPKLCALWLDDKRLVKMVLETAQLLSSAVRYKKPSVKGLYADTHKNHPCAVWTRKSRGNFLWLCAHGFALCDAYTATFGRVHKSEEVIRKASKHDLLFTDAPRTPFVNCTPFKSPGDDRDIHEKYRAYMLEKWSQDRPSPRFTKRSNPKQEFAKCDTSDRLLL